MPLLRHRIVIGKDVAGFQGTPFHGTVPNLYAKYGFRLTDQPQLFKLPLMLGPGGQEVDAGSLDTAVSQHVSQPCNVPAYLIKSRSKKMPEVVGKHLATLHARRVAKLLHLRPDLPAGHPLAAAREEDLTDGDFLFFGIFQKFFAEFSGKQDGAYLAFEGDVP